MVRKVLFVFMATLFIAQFLMSEERRVALVIGNSAYAETPLKNPVNDATDIAAALKESGFAVTLLPNATREAMEKAIRDLGNALKSGGVGLFYYAGHGVQMKGRNYLIPIGADIQEEDEVGYKAVDADLVLAKMESAGNGTNIVILDACRTNPFPGAARALGDRGLAVVGVQPAGSYIIYATQPNATAQDGSGRNGVFTKNLLANLKVPGLDIDLMLRRVRDAVRAETGNAQVPWSSSSLSSAGFMFVPGTGSAAAPDSPAELEVIPEVATPFENLLKTAVKGDVIAQFNIANAYYNGVGVAKNFTESVKWYRIAADQGNADAQYNLGVAFYTGTGIYKDFAEAVKWFVKAAQQGETNAQCSLGQAYFNGDGVDQDYVAAVKWYQTAAEQGNPYAQGGVKSFV